MAAASNGAGSRLGSAGTYERNLDDLGLSLDFNAQANHGVQPQHAEAAGHSLPWPVRSPSVATSSAGPGAFTTGVAHFLGMA